MSESLYIKGSEYAYFGYEFFEFLSTELKFVFLCKNKIGGKPNTLRSTKMEILVFTAMLLHSVNNTNIIYQRIIEYKRHISFSKQTHTNHNTI